MRTFFIIVLFALFSCADRTSNFVVQNLNDQALVNLHLKSTTSDWISDSITVSPKAQGVINMPPTNDLTHEGLIISFVSNNKQQNCNFSVVTDTVPTTESFMMTINGDTVDLKTFHVE